MFSNWEITYESNTIIYTVFYYGKVLVKFHVSCIDFYNHFLFHLNIPIKRSALMQLTAIITLIQKVRQDIHLVTF